ncbi:MAG TPA: POTRA domain-containing protein [Candidatus Angelobacter sp.]|nr:POTRA domain-containing protein [Candidatus Angelobacter sp.]
MLRHLRAGLASLSFLLLGAPFPSLAQTPDNQTAALREVHVDGQKRLSEAQVVSLTGLVLGSQVGRADLQAAADKLVQSGLFAKVSYNFQTRTGVIASYHVEEAPRIPAYFDNIPWFADSELADAIRTKLPFFDGTLPEAGAAVDLAAEAIKELLASHNVQVSLEHMVIGDPLGEGHVQQFHIEGSSLRISRLEFSDPSLLNSKVAQQHLSEILGKPYSRMTIDLFLTEAIRPVYLQQGYLHVKLGPPEIRLSGPPAQKLPEQIPVYVPVTLGAVYHWGGVHWNGNQTVSEFTLTGLMGIKAGDVANGMQIEAGWDHAREELAHHGFLDAKVDPVASYDESAHAVSYSVAVQEGLQYHFGKMVLTGLSPAAEKKLHTAWPVAAGDVFDKTKYEEILTKLQRHQEQIFGELPLHYENVGHWLENDASTGIVNVLLDFK